MKILILCAQPNSILSTGMINSLSTIYAYHFNKWLSRYVDCNISFNSAYLKIDEINSVDNYDFCIILVNRGVKTMKNAIFEILRTKIKYQIITICATNSIIDKEDLLLFTMGQSKPKTKRLYWGADFDLLKPLKSNTINVLVDHKYYGKPTSNMYKNDKTEIFIKSLLKYKNDGHDIIIKHIGAGQVHEVTNDYKIQEYKQSLAMDFREIYKYYNEAHIYIVTHAESFGLTTIECASAGALIVEPISYIKTDIINRLHHVSITDMDHINWDDIIKQININKSINMAKVFSYQNAIKQLYYHMKTICINTIQV